MHDVYEPLARFRDEFAGDFASRAAAFFDELVARSGIDVRAHTGTCAQLNWVAGERARHDASRSNWQLLRALAICVALAAAGTAFCLCVPDVLPKDAVSLTARVLGTAGAVAAAALAIWFAAGVATPRLRATGDYLARLAAKHGELTRRAAAQMAPLNALHDWHHIPALVQQTVPRLELDPWFTRGRLDELRDTFGWDDSFNAGKSVLFAQSGAINGNPFVIVETLECAMRDHTYTGTLFITWTEWTTDSKGNPTTVTRCQTLVASVTKPAPAHRRRKVVIYGNEAAPALTFSRHPSDLSDAADDFFGKWRVNREIKKLEKLSRNLDDDSGYTIVSNREFAALFHATDRNDEVQYRLLFTPLAQQQMLALLKDRTTGYGDNFSFIKHHRLNFVFPAHLDSFDISANPARFRHHDLAAARREFTTYATDYFRAFYFALAPLLTIPLYQQHRTRADIYRDPRARRASFWEHEAIANHHGDAPFRHPRCATPCILKTEIAGENAEEVERTALPTTVLRVTAHGYSATQCVEHIPVLGGDGHIHVVPVEWTRFDPVSRTTDLRVSEQPGSTVTDWQRRRDALSITDPVFTSALFRRSILSATGSDD
ncbi:MAG: hypothetical protein LBR07_04645 [Puniceicoccales bacterium]|jgi:hypothetical protein|nr:hypothetical protein [Puniceicoccales bacterium]